MIKYCFSRLMILLAAAALLYGIASPVSAESVEDDSAEVFGAALRRMFERGGGVPTPTPAPMPQYPLIELSGEIPEKPSIFQLFTSDSPTLRGVTAVIQRAKSDPNVEGIVIRLDAPRVGWARMEQLRRSIQEFEKTGRPAHCIMQSEDSLGYLIAASCSRIVMPESSTLNLTGLRAEMYFFRDTLQKIGVEVDSVAMGQYKDAMEFLTENEMSAATREMLASLIDDLTSESAAMIAHARKIPVDRARALFEGGPYTAAEALDLGLIDRVEYADQYVSAIEEEAGHPIELAADYGNGGRVVESMNPFVLLRELLQPPRKEKGRGRPYIALVYATGEIVSGRSEDYPYSENLIAQDDFLEILDEIESDDSARGLVLRIDSPGGSAEASDVIWNRISLIREQIPVAASMGDLAASGGYYIAMPADTIFAEKTTLTGSIGVIGGKVVLGGLYDKIGVRTQSLGGGKFSGLFSEKSRWNEDERQKMIELLDDTYDRFVRKAAMDREMTPDEMENFAQGRVWTGRQAAERYLVDKIGGLEDAIQFARDKSGDPSPEKLEVVVFPRPLTLGEYLQRLLQGGAVQAGGVHGQGIHAKTARESATSARLPRLSRMSERGAGIGSRAMLSSQGQSVRQNIEWLQGVISAYGMEKLLPAPLREGAILVMVLRSSPFLAHAPYRLSIR